MIIGTVSVGLLRGSDALFFSRKDFSLFCAGCLGALLTKSYFELNSQLEVSGRSKK